MDSHRGIHFHGTKSSSYAFEISNSRVIIGENLNEIFRKINHYDIFSQYFNACRFINLFLKNLDNDKNKKGINYSFILAKECLIRKNILISYKEEMAKEFNKKINKKFGRKLSKILKLRGKRKLEIKDLEEIYEFLTFCQKFLGREVNKNKMGVRKIPKIWSRIQE